ncbi:MAG: methyltransferase domain-containing protein [Magnetococcales bacterium]|nr:methyltransferase domain-containing protein [Magnetococcales bacterium]
MNSEIDNPLRLHIGGEEVKPGWKILNIVPGENVDFVGDCSDLSQFADSSVTEVYASHVLEHLGYEKALPNALAELFRVLKPKGKISISVPDLDMLCRLFVDSDLPQELTLTNGSSQNVRFHIMRIMFGGRTNPYDVHYVGLTKEFLTAYLLQAGFVNINRVEELNIFEDCSSDKLFGNLISLNMTAQKS